MLDQNQREREKRREREGDREKRLIESECPDMWTLLHMSVIIRVSGRSRLEAVSRHVSANVFTMIQSTNNIMNLQHSYGWSFDCVIRYRASSSFFFSLSLSRFSLSLASLSLASLSLSLSISLSRSLSLYRFIFRSLSSFYIIPLPFSLSPLPVSLILCP